MMNPMGRGLRGDVSLDPPPPNRCNLDKGSINKFLGSNFSCEDITPLPPGGRGSGRARGGGLTSPVLHEAG
eukprot:1817389-Prymnesium_polylepis.1